MAVNKRPGPKAEVDLDATDELPQLVLPETGEAQANTDVFPTPVIPAGMAELADSLRDVEHRLQRKLERVQKLESDLAVSAQQQRDLEARLQQEQEAAAAREAALRRELEESGAQRSELQSRHDATRGELTSARDQLQEQLVILNQTRHELGVRSSERTHQDHDLAEWRRRAERAHEALTTWQGFRAVSEALLGESEQALLAAEAQHGAALGAAQARVTALENDLAAARTDAFQRIAALEETLKRAEQTQQAQAEALRVAAEHAAALSAQLAARDASIAELQAQLAELRAVEEKARRGAQTYDEQVRQLTSLQSMLDTVTARIRDLEQQLRQSQERVKRLESEAHASAALMGNLQRNMERLGADDTGSRPVLKESGLENLVRVLIRQEGGADVVYPLGRRTSVGRTAENDIQIDTSYVSRHHAVLLSSPDVCIVEDLNSTNGVLVNGHKVGRQVLQDGDTVTFGKTEFRYQQRSAS
jgi:chromosome segregation ATPase